MTQELIVNEKYRIMPKLTPEQHAALKASIKTHNVKEEVLVDEDYNILDGFERYECSDELRAEGCEGIECPFRVVPGLSESEKRALIRSLNISRRHLTREQVRKVIADELREDAERSDRLIGDTLGVDHKTVASVRRKLIEEGQLGNFPSCTGVDGRTRPRNGSKKAPISDSVEVDDDLDGEMCLLADSGLSDESTETGALIKVGHYWDVLADVADGSAQLVYSAPEGFVDIEDWQKLSEFAAQKLEPGGMALIYCDNAALPTAIAGLSSNLDYEWTISVVNGDIGKQFGSSDQRGMWIPLLVFVNPDCGGSFTNADVHNRAEGRYACTIGVREAEHYIATMSSAGSLVIDPCIGTAAIPLAAVAKGREFRGCSPCSDVVERCYAEFRTARLLR